MRNYKRRSNTKISYGNLFDVTFDLGNWYNTLQDLSRIKDGQLLQELDRDVLRPWASSTHAKYDSLTGYGHMLIDRNGKSYDLSSGYYTMVRDSHLKIVVGHEQFIARFLEVGTRQHPVSRSGKLLTRTGVRRATWTIPARTGTWSLQNVVAAEESVLKNRIDDWLSAVLRGIGGD